MLPEHTGKWADVLVITNHALVISCGDLFLTMYFIERPLWHRRLDCLTVMDWAQAFHTKYIEAGPPGRRLNPLVDGKITSQRTVSSPVESSINFGHELGIILPS